MPDDIQKSSTVVNGPRLTLFKDTQCPTGRLMLRGHSHNMMSLKFSICIY